MRASSSGTCLYQFKFIAHHQPKSTNLIIELQRGVHLPFTHAIIYQMIPGDRTLYILTRRSRKLQCLRLLVISEDAPNMVRKLQRIPQIPKLFVQGCSPKLPPSGHWSIFLRPIPGHACFICRGALTLWKSSHDRRGRGGISPVRRWNWIWKDSVLSAWTIWR